MQGLPRVEVKISRVKQVVDGEHEPVPFPLSTCEISLKFTHTCAIPRCYMVMI
jgi:hypothetical protein